MASLYAKIDSITFDSFIYFKSMQSRNGDSCYYSYIYYLIVFVFCFQITFTPFGTDFMAPGDGFGLSSGVGGAVGDVGGREQLPLALVLLQMLKRCQPVVLLLGRAGGEQEPLVAAEAAHLEGVPRRAVKVYVLSVWNVKDFRVLQRQPILVHQRIPLHQFLHEKGE